MSEWYEQYLVDVPEGVSGDYAIKKFVIDAYASKVSRMRADLNPHRKGRDFVPEGTFTKLINLKKSNGSPVIMSDVPSEMREHRRFINKAHGKVLIHGLGLGMCVQAVLNKSEVEHVTVIEVSDDIYKLCAHHYFKKFGHDRLEITIADALTWKPDPNSYWDVVWHDIWPALSSDNLVDMVKLHRRFGRRCGWQGSWQRDFCESARDYEHRMRDKGLIPYFHSEIQ